MQLNSTQIAALDRDNRQFFLATGQLYSAFVQDILTAQESGAVGITAVAGDVDSVALGGGAFTYDKDNSSGLTFAYKLGRLHNGKSLVSVAAGTVALSASATNYVEVNRTGTVSANTTAFTAGRLPLYVVVTGVASISTVTSSKTLLTLIGANGVDGSMLSTPGQTKEIAINVGAVSATTIVTATVPTTIAAGSKLTKARIVNATAIAANDTDYYTFGVVNKGAGGVGTQAIADATAASNSTKATGGSALVAYQGRDLTLATLTAGTERDVTGGDTLAITITKTNAPSALASCSVILEFSFVN